MVIIDTFEIQTWLTWPDNHVTIISLPTHFTFKLQPLDRAFMWPLKTYYSEAVTVWLQKNGSPFTPYDVVENFTQAYIRTQTAEIAINGDKPDSSDLHLLWWKVLWRQSGRCVDEMWTHLDCAGAERASYVSDFYKYFFIL